MVCSRTDASLGEFAVGTEGLPTYRGKSTVTPRRPPTGTSRPRDHSGSAAPSQQFAFMWQCGHSHRVAIGSNSRPQ